VVVALDSCIKDQRKDMFQGDAGWCRCDAGILSECLFSGVVPNFYQHYQTNFSGDGSFAYKIGSPEIVESGALRARSRMFGQSLNNGSRGRVFNSLPDHTPFS